MTARRALRALSAGGVLACLLLGLAAPAAAEVSGSCDALIKGVSAKDRSSTDTSQAIDVEADEVVPYSVASSLGVTRHRFLMEYAGIQIEVDSGTSKGDTDFSSGEAAVKDYAWLGAGLYKVIGEATLKDGSTCSGAVLVNVKGNPLTTLTGIVGVISVIIGLIGLVLSSGTGAGGVIDELVTFLTGPDAPEEGATTGSGAEPAAETTAPPPESEEPVAKKPPRGGVPPVGADPITPTAGAAGAGAAAAAAAAAAAGAAGATGGTPGDGGGAAEEPKPPPLPGMGLVTGTGEKADVLIKAHETLTETLGELPLTEEQHEKLTETLGLETIKEKLDQVKEVTDTVTHFEEVGTETVDNLNRWGVPPRMVEAILWFRWTTEASGRATQKFTDGIVTPVLEPVTKALGEAGVEADAEEIAHAILPFQEAAEEASKAAMTTVKNVLGGQQAIDQRAEGAFEDEWNIARPRSW